MFFFVSHDIKLNRIPAHKTDLLKPTADAILTERVGKMTLSLVSTSDKLQDWQQSFSVAALCTLTDTVDLLGCCGDLKELHTTGYTCKPLN